MHQERIQRVGCQGLLHFGVHHDILGQRNVDITVDVHMRNAAVVAEDRHLGLLLHHFTKPRAAARNDRIQCLAGLDQFQRRLLLRTLNDRTGAERNPGICGSLRETGGNGLLRQRPIRGTAEHTDVTGLQAERQSVDRFERRQFRHNTDHPDRHTHAADLEPVGFIVTSQHLTERIRQIGDPVQPVHHGLDVVGRHTDPRNRVSDPFPVFVPRHGLPDRVHILFIGGQDVLFCLRNCGCHPPQCLIPGRTRHEGKRTHGFTG